MDELRRKIEVIVARYERLELKTPDYQFLKDILNDAAWMSKTANLISKVDNLEKVFNISKEITVAKNDQRLSEAFAELDTADRLVNTKFFGNYDHLTYIPTEKNKRRPDFVAMKGIEITPVEVKLLTPADLDENKFFQKFIDKINNHALPQLESYHKDYPFERSYIFVWTYQPVRLENLEYYDLREWVDKRVERKNFNVTILFMQYMRGMWDFPLLARN
jgi:hypothetical protein